MIHANERMVLTTALLAVVLLVTVLGCAPRSVPDRILHDPESAWETFRSEYCHPAKAPAMLVKASLYYTRTYPTQRTNRTRVSLFGNFGGSMRLDVAAGMGKLIAHISDDESGLLVFYPTQKTAYSHTNPVLGAIQLGLPFPFSLVELGNIIMGDFSTLVPNGYMATTRTDKGFMYALSGSSPSKIVLDDGGRPIRLEGYTVKGRDGACAWRLDIDRYSENQGAYPLPNRLTLSMENGEKGVLHIKARELRMAYWSDKAMTLSLPENVMVRRLDKGYGAKQDDEISDTCGDDS